MRVLMGVFIDWVFRNSYLRYTPFEINNASTKESRRRREGSEEAVTKWLLVRLSYMVHNSRGD